jgi:hypothetical protein
MNYKELLDTLKNLSEDQLKQKVLVIVDERVKEMEYVTVTEEDLYIDEECPEIGFFPLNEMGTDTADLQLAYPKGTIFLEDY